MEKKGGGGGGGGGAFGGGFVRTGGSLSPSSITADGSSTSTVTATVTDLGTDRRHPHLDLLTPPYGSSPGASPPLAVRETTRRRAAVGLDHGRAATGSRSLAPSSIGTGLHFVGNRDGHDVNGNPVSGDTVTSGTSGAQTVGRSRRGLSRHLPEVTRPLSPGRRRSLRPTSQPAPQPRARHVRQFHPAIDLTRSPARRHPIEARSALGVHDPRAVRSEQPCLLELLPGRGSRGLCHPDAQALLPATRCRGAHDPGPRLSCKRLPAPRNV